MVLTVQLPNTGSLGITTDVITTDDTTAGESRARPPAKRSVATKLVGVPGTVEIAGSVRLAVSRCETAELLGVHPNTVDDLRKRGLLRPSLATRRPMYLVAEVLRFLTDTQAIA